MLVKSQIKYIQSLGQKKHRDEAGVFIAEGPKIVKELLEEIPGQVMQVFATEKWAGENSNKASERGLIMVTDAELERLSQLSTPNQVLAVVKKIVMPAAIDISGKIVLALDAIQDPGNLGTIIRIADWFGLDQLVCGHECADMYNPKVVQSTMGSIARVKVIYTDLAAWLALENNVSIYAASLEGQDVRKIKKPGEGIVVIGNESKGISEEIMKQVTEKITIPKKGKAESLNAAVAAGIILSYVV